jgi:hypothetical protein
MTRHATTLIHDQPLTAPVRVQVAWPALIARDELGRSTNALLDPGTAVPVGSTPTPTPTPTRNATPVAAIAPRTPATLRPVPAATSPLRRIRIVATIEAITERDDRVRFAVHLEEDGQHRIVVPPGIVGGSISTVGHHLHAVVEGDERPGRPASLLTVVLDDRGRELMVRGRLDDIAGLPPGAAGRPCVSLDPAETDGHYPPASH